MAEEDLIFGKNRHMFGGMEPSNMLGFEIASRINAIKILALLPEDTTIDGQTLCTVAGAVVRRRTDKYPEDEFDGDLVADIKESGFVIDSSAKLSATYYYAAFPYTTQGVYNRCSENRVKYIPSESYYIYGFDLDTENPDPDPDNGRVTYPSDVLNFNFAPAKMNFTGTTTEGTFDYGGWPSTAGIDFMPRPCMLKYDGTVDYYLDPNDYTKSVDGTSSDYGRGSYEGNAMMEWPKIYTKRELVNGIYKFRCASKKIDDSYECWCNYDINNNEIDHFYTSIPHPCCEYWDGDRWLMKTTGGELFSRIKAHSSSMYEAGLNGPDWTIEVLSDHLLIQDLLVMLARTTDCKTAYGKGFDENKSGTNLSQTEGLFFGSYDGRVKVFGMIDYWDGFYRRELAGWVLDENGKQRIKLTRGTKDGSTATDYSRTGDGYLAAPDIIGGGYVSEYKVESYGRIPIDFSGSSTTYECDYIAGTTTHVSVSGLDESHRMALISVDGPYLNRPNGPFGADLYEPQDHMTYIYASLSCKPRKTTS